LRIPTKNRKAISPVLATVILIAITLIAAIAIAGFVFGLFGSFTSSAQVSARVVACASTSLGGAGSHANNNECTVVLTNTGTSNVAVTGGSEQIGGVASTCNNGALAGVVFVAPSTSLTVGASSSTTVQCLQATATTGQTIGSEAIGTFSLSNGASVPFSGVWS